MSANLRLSGDFVRMVAAVLPAQAASALAEVSAAEVERHFASLGADELVLP